VTEVGLLEPFFRMHFFLYISELPMSLSMWRDNHTWAYRTIQNLRSDLQVQNNLVDLNNQEIIHLERRNGSLTNMLAETKLVDRFHDTKINSLQRELRASSGAGRSS